MSNSYIIFENQLASAYLDFPNLRIKVKDGKKILKGIIDIENSEHKVVQSFLIEIHCSKGFPYRFPILFEVGNDIPCDVDWHKYSDNSCCITVQPDEILQCKNGITISQFIKNNVIPYFANQYYKKITGNYKDEFPHGKEGLIKYYSELMKTMDKNKWIKYVNYTFDIEKIKIGRNDLCFCGSSVKFKKCHNLVFEKIKAIGKNNIMNHLEYLINY